MEPKFDYEAVVPVGVELPHDTFILLHQDGNSQNLATFTEVFADNIIRHMVDFLRGCGHYDDVIYGCMRDICDEYFDCQEKKQKHQPLVPDDLDSDPVLG
jgi:hypothetical protein